MKDRYENLDEYIADLRAALSQNDGCANHHYNLGVALLSKGDFVGAEESFLAAVRSSIRTISACFMTTAPSPAASTASLRR